MNINQLPKITKTPSRRLGQGHGSGRVKTAGRGTKGQKARRNIPLRFEGGALPLIKRLPFLRGKNRNNSLQEKPVVLSLTVLNTLPKNTSVTIKTLIDHKLVSETEVKKKGVKILGEGSLSTALTVQVPVSQNAREKIEQAGGSVSLVTS